MDATAAMATLTLKNVPEELVEQLKEEAKQNRRSLNQEAIFRLEVSLRLRHGPARRGGPEVRLGGMKPLSGSFISRAKRQGRP